MPSSSTYYLNGLTFATSTAIYLDAALTTCAPDGSYSDGTIIRAQVGCVLGPAEACPTCPLPPFDSSERQLNYQDPAYCSLPTDQTYYYQSSVSPIYPYLSENDYVFFDSAGTTPLNSLFYKVPYTDAGTYQYDTIQVDTNGKITDLLLICGTP
jgi:hypothetical protein